MLTLLAALQPVSVRADLAPRWTDRELVGFAKVIVTGKVTRIATRRDTAVDAIYTYVTVELDEVVKGELRRKRITLKQLGGRVGDRTLLVAGQARFELEDEVLLFLETRPRDATLYTSAFWQGKWNIEQDPTTGERVAFRDMPTGVTQRATVPSDTRALDPFLATLRSLTSELPGWAATPIRFNPGEAASAVADPIDPLGFGLFGPGRWHEADSATPVLIDTHSLGQTGLAGLGGAEIAAARGAWNGNSSLVLGGGGSTGFGCFGDSRGGDGRIRISFMDPCGEMDDSGGTLAAATFWFTSGQDKVVNGTTFVKMITGTVINNNSASALAYLTNSSCFYIIQVHELGHAIGLGHSGDSGAIMYPFISGACFGGNLPLGGDDIAGVQFIYPTESPPPPPTPESPGSPTGMATVVSDTTATHTWLAPEAFETVLNAGVATSYVLQIGTASGLSDVFNTDVGNTTTATTTHVPGTYFARVVAKNNAGSSDPSNETTFVISAPDVCSAAPAAPPTMTNTVDGSSVAISWTSPGGGVNEPTSYLLEAGTASGLADLLNADQGNTTSVTVADVGDGTYYLRARAVNECGTSIASSETVATVGSGGPGTCSAAPGAPATLTGNVTGSTITLNWSASTGANAATSYRLEVGSAAGQSDVLNSDQGNTTSLIASGVGAGTYFIRVRAANACAVSGPSPEVVVGVGGGGTCTTPPGEPTGLSGSANGSTVTLSWTAPVATGLGAGGADRVLAANEPTTYLLHVGSAPGQTDLGQMDLGSAATSLVAHGVGAATYHVRVLGRNACGAGPASNAATVTVQ